VQCPLLELWGRHTVIARCFSPLTEWQDRAVDVRGRALDCGHYLPEELPEETLGEILGFLA